ncbi:TauD/TfdA dioxygenase family protein [Acetobacter papayae]|uniref:TauD/TfdA dioxygenase family protein n=1 Tax=Acetobacter papayae TaxID=1076592 RepID=UPI0022771BD0|nr:TauD/TfdA family dioxygenase [Acetobacter papayae]
MTFMSSYPKASILRCIQPAPYGGATLWANTVTAYEGLPKPLQELADKLWAIHTNDGYDHTDLVAERDWEFVQWSANVFAARVFEARHPLVRIHPETGEKSLILGNFIKRLADFNLPDSNALLELFLSHATRPENTLTWHWQAGDVAMWDNRAALHRAVADFGDFPRLLQRVTLVGDTPVSTDGRESEQIINAQPNRVCCSKHRTTGLNAHRPDQPAPAFRDRQPCSPRKARGGFYGIGASSLLRTALCLPQPMMPPRTPFRPPGRGGCSARPDRIFYPDHAALSLPCHSTADRFTRPYGTIPGGSRSCALPRAPAVLCPALAPKR